jgi:hypothetical protein
MITFAILTTYDSDGTAFGREWVGGELELDSVNLQSEHIPPADILRPTTGWSSESMEVLHYDARFP